MGQSVKSWWGYFFANSQLIGHDSADVARWLDAHPEFNGALYFNFGDGSDDMEVTEIFAPDEDDEPAYMQAAQ